MRLVVGAAFLLAARAKEVKHFNGKRGFCNLSRSRRRTKSNIMCAPNSSEMENEKIFEPIWLPQADSRRKLAFILFIHDSLRLVAHITTSSQLRQQRSTDDDDDDRRRVKEERAEHAEKTQNYLSQIFLSSKWFYNYRVCCLYEWLRWRRPKSHHQGVRTAVAIGSVQVGACVDALHNVIRKY